MVGQSQAFQRNDGLHPASAWFFQAQPREWDVDWYLADVASGATSNELNWLVTTYADTIAAGDRVYVWRAGREAGVLAVATVIEPPSPRAEDKGAYRQAGFETKYAKETCRARLRIDAILTKPLSRVQLRFMPDLQDLSILHNFRRTNVPVDPRHEAVLAARVDAASKSWTS